MIFEILTIVPVWIVQKCVVHGKSMNARSGLLAVGSRDLGKMLRREEKLGYLMNKIMEEECGDEGIPRELLDVMFRCVEFDPIRRPKYQDIIDLLK